MIDTDIDLEINDVEIDVEIDIEIDVRSSSLFALLQSPVSVKLVGLFVAE